MLNDSRDDLIYKVPLREQLKCQNLNVYTNIIVCLFLLFKGSLDIIHILTGCNNKSAKKASLLAIRS